MNHFPNLLTYRKCRIWMSLILMWLVQANAYAQNKGGLTRAREGLARFQNEILLVVPILAVIACVIIGMLYAKDMIRKEIMWQWLVGIVIAGSATEVVALFL